MICNTVEVHRISILEVTSTSNSQAKNPTISKPNCLINVGCEIGGFATFHQVIPRYFQTASIEDAILLLLEQCS